MDYRFPEEDKAEANHKLIGGVIAVIVVIIAVILIARGCSSNAADNETVSDSGNKSGITEQLPRQNDNGNIKAVQMSKTESERTQAAAGTMESALSQKSEPKPPSSAVLALLEKGQVAEQQEEYEIARRFYEEAMADPDCGDALPLVENRLGGVFIKLITTPHEMAEKIDYAIASGDRIARLSNKYKTTDDLITVANNISNPNNIKIGDRLRILNNAKFKITVNRKENWLLVTMNGKFFKRYIVGTGRYNRTPPGTFKIVEKQKNPSWWKDNKEIPFGDKENILGTRWMELQAIGTTPPAKGYGIHGTWDNTSLGSQSSAGCIRMDNRDVEELFTYIPYNTEVTIE